MGKSVRPVVIILVIVLFSGIVAAQSPDATPRFEIADIHTSAKSQREVMRTGPVRNGRYEIGNATMLDLLRIAWGLPDDRILGGPNWLELDRFDVVAKAPGDATPENRQFMLQELLKDRFKLVAHEETKPIPSWTLSVGKKPLMKEADGSGETGCKVQTGASISAQEGGGRLVMSDRDGKTTTISLGPGAMLQYSCRNMTMAAFADGMRTMALAQINTPVLDRTGLKGTWNFELRYSLPLIGPAASTADRVSIVDALEKQLGLKLEQTPVPQTVLVVERVERKPTDNPPEVRDVLPAVKPPTEFEVADVKLASAPGGLPGLIGLRVQPGGRFVAEGMPMRMLINRAFNVSYNDQIVGWPTWVDSVRVSITAKMPSDYAGGPGIDPDVLAPLLRSLLVERFGLVWHNEDRTGTAYRLITAKPKVKKADPDSRIYCRNAPPGPGQPPGGQVFTCQNAPMSMLAERLQTMAGINAPVTDATGLEGGWDFTLTFNPLAQAMLSLPPGVGRGGDAGAPGGPIAASEPTGVATIFETIEKQLGLKLEMQKRPIPVTVIDKLNQKPTDN